MQSLDDTVNLPARKLYDLQALMKNIHCTRASLLRIEVAKRTCSGLRLSGASVRVLTLAVRLADGMPAFPLVTASTERTDS
jgi:hypothetical protein